MLQLQSNMNLNKLPKINPISIYVILPKYFRIIHHTSPNVSPQLLFLPHPRHPTKFQTILKQFFYPILNPLPFRIKMADHELLKSEIEFARTASLPYLTPEGWTVLDTEDGFTTSLFASSPWPVLKVEGEVNKDPLFMLQYIPQHTARIREAYFSMHKGIELLHVFEDTSRITKETLEIFGVGEVVQYKFHVFKIGEEGALTTLATSAATESYPAASVNVVFYTVRATPIGEGRSHLSMMIQSSYNLEVSEQDRNYALESYRGFFRGNLIELNKAVQE